MALDRPTMFTFRSLGCLAVSVLIFLCGREGLAQAPAAQVLSSDPELSAMAARLLPELASRAGMELREPVRLERRSREELVRYLQVKLDEEFPEEEARNRSRAYSLFGMLPPDFDLRGVLMGLYTEQVAGFYEPDSTALFVLDDQPHEALEALLVHELVHAVQDQSADLHALTDSERGSDRATAAQATIEGHATLVMFEYLTEQMTGAAIDLGAIPDFGAQVRPALAAMNSQFPALANAPRVVRDVLLFPYVDGAGYVQHLWADRERRSPFGESMPQSTEQVIWPDAAPPTDLDLSVRGARVLFDDVLGALETNMVLEDVLGLPGGQRPYGGAAGALTAAWDGDRYSLVVLPDGSTMLVWAILWSSADARDRFVEAVTSPGSRFGGPVTAEALTLGGRPAAMVHIGAGTVSATATLRAEAR